jgi:hypothetical protein
LRFGNSRNRSTDARSRRCRRALGRSAHATDVEWEVMGLRRLAPPPGCGCLALVAGVLVVVGQTAAQCNAPTDADCFRQFLAGRTGVDALPECDGEQATDGSALSGSWCRCAASVGGTLDNFVGWIDDDSCDRLFDTEACYEDGGDCTPSVRRVLTQTRLQLIGSHVCCCCTRLIRYCARLGAALPHGSEPERNRKCMRFQRGSCRHFHTSSDLHSRLCRVVPPMAVRVLMGRRDWRSSGMGVGRF